MYRFDLFQGRAWRFLAFSSKFRVTGTERFFKFRTRYDEDPDINVKGGSKPAIDGMSETSESFSDSYCSLVVAAWHCHTVNAISSFSRPTTKKPRRKREAKLGQIWVSAVICGACEISINLLRFTLFRVFLILRIGSYYLCVWWKAAKVCFCNYVCELTVMMSVRESRKLLLLS